MSDDVHIALNWRCKIFVSAILYALSWGQLSIELRRKTPEVLDDTIKHCPRELQESNRTLDGMAPMNSLCPTEVLQG